MILAADTKTVDQRLVPFRAAALQIIQKTPPAGNHQQQPAPGMVIFLVGLKMIGQLRDPLAEEGYLHLRRATVRFMRPVLPNYLLFNLCRQ
jgi:hypothetical protein